MSGWAHSCRMHTVKYPVLHAAHSASAKQRAFLHQDPQPPTLDEVISLANPTEVAVNCQINLLSNFPFVREGRACRLSGGKQPLSSCEFVRKYKTQPHLYRT